MADMAEKKKTSAWDQIFKKEWSYAQGAVLLALLALTLVIVTGSAWGVTGPFAIWGGWFLRLFGVDVDSWAIFKSSPVAGYSFWKSQPSVTNLGIILGALLAVLLAGSFKLKKIKSSRQVAAAVLGGLFMGIGARLALGCNIGSWFSALPAFSLNGWIFMVSSFWGRPWAAPC